MRIEGTIQTVEDAVADAYYASRPLARQLMAWAAKQSQKMSSPAILAEKFDHVKQQFADKTLTRPRWWLGFCVAPETIEFWQQAENLQHQRVRYCKLNQGWRYDYLYP